MIQKISKITLYVNDQEQAKKFWVNQVGFLVALEQSMGPVKWLEVTPGSLAATNFVLYDKKQMKEDNPGVCVDNPSVILSADDIEETYDRLKAKEVKVGKLMKLPYGSMFSFSDQDGNEFLIRDN